MTVKLKCDSWCNGSSDMAEIEIDIINRTFNIGTTGRILESGDVDIELPLTEVMQIIREAGL